MDNLTYHMKTSLLRTGALVGTALAAGLSGFTAQAVAQTTSLIPTNAVWHYLATGTDPGVAWRAPGFNDSSWASGPGPLGYGETFLNTVLNLGSGTNRLLTAYFRRNFAVSDPAAVTDLTVRLLRDDGAVVYLNGTEVLRQNMPAGAVSYGTFATTVVGGADETTYFTNTIPAGLLTNGTNVLAVEVHQNAAASTDLSFDLELLGTRAAPPSPYLSAPGDQRLPAVAASTNLYLVVWADRRSAAQNESDIYAARVTPAGRLLDVGGIRVCSLPQEQVYPSVASDGRDFLVVWEDSRDIYSGGNDSDLYGARVTAEGQVLDPDGFPISSAPARQSNPSVAWNGACYLSVWHDSRPSTAAGTVFDIYGARVSASGTVLDPAGIALCTATNLQWSPMLSACNGDFFVAWIDLRDYPTVSGALFGTRVTGAGTVVHPNGLRLTPDSPAGYPALAANATGYLLAWGANRCAGAGCSEVLAVRLSPSGEPVLTNVLVLQSGSQAEPYPSAAATAGEFLVVWPDSPSGSNTARVLGTRVNASGIVAPQGFPIAPRAARQGENAPAVASAGGDYLVAWVGPQEGSTNATDVFATRVSGQGVVLDPNGLLVSTDPHLRPTISWVPPAPISYGTPLDSQQLNATANVPGTFLYTPPAGTILAAGTYALSVSFTPQDLSAYAPTLATTPLTVSPALLTITADNKRKVQGQPNPPLTASYVGFRNGDSPANLDAPVQLTTTATSSSPVGVYPILASGARDLNYTINHGHGTLTVVAAPEPHPGAFDPSFAAWVTEWCSVHGLVRQADGRFLIAGSFTDVSGVPRDGLARLHAEGSLDLSFTASFLPHGAPSALALRTDGKLLVGGWFTNVNGEARPGLARLNPNGSLDASFQPPAGELDGILALAIQPDGKVLAAGYRYQPLPWQYRVVRFLPTGALDPTFALSESVDGLIYALAIQPDGQVLACGSFTRVNGVARPGIVRLTSTGATDATFAPVWGGLGIINLALDPVGRMVLAGSLRNSNGVYQGVARLLPNGSLDPGFFCQTDGGTGALALQPDGKVLVGGSFTQVGGVPRNGLARLNFNGTVDTGFDPGEGVQPITDGTVRVIVLQPDGQIVIAGSEFISYDGFPCSSLARVIGQNAPIAPVISVPPRGLTVPYGQSASFSVTATGTLPLSYQWQKDGVNLSGRTNATLSFGAVQSSDAGGYRVVVANAGGSVTSVVATLTVTVIPPQYLSTEPFSQSVVLGEPVSFAVGASGQPAPTLQWFWNGQPLAGATNAILRFPRVALEQAGFYYAVAANSGGALTSRVATLQVVLPGPLDDWTWRNPLPQGNDLTSVAAGHGIIVAVGPERTSLSSADGGLSWRANPDHDSSLGRVVFGNGRFVALASRWMSGDVFAAFVGTSTNGHDWLVREASELRGFEGLAFGNGRFVAVSSTAQAATSTDGVQWTVTPSAALHLAQVVAFGNGLFVAITPESEYAALAQIAFSTDGVTWTNRSLNLSGALQGLAWGNGRFVLFGRYPAFGPAGTFVSADLASWEAYPLPGSSLRAIAFGAGRFTLVPDEPEGAIFTSTDGANWTSLALAPTNELYAVTFADAQFTAVGERGNLFTSPDGLTWTTRSAGTDVNFRGVARGDPGYVAVGNEGLLFTSPDGLAWTRQPPPTSNNLRGVVFGAGRFIAVGENDSVGGTVLVSTNGSRWTRLAANSNTPSLYDVTFAQNRFVAIGSGGRALVSPDGVAWTNPPVGTTEKLNSIGFDGQTFIAVGRNLTIVTSPDGTNWTRRAYSEDSTFLQGIAYGNGTYVGVGKRGSVITATNLTGWQWRATPFSSDLEDVLFANGLFVAVGQGGFCATSPDGLLWTVHPTRCQNDLRTIIYADGLFTTVGNNETILQSAYAGTPRLLIPPADVTVTEGQTATFSVTASGMTPLSYQWLFNGGTIPGATNPALVLSHVQAAQAGRYTVALSNAVGRLTSSAATLTVLPGSFLGEALDAGSLVWRTGGAAPWFGQTNLSHDGLDAARSGSLTQGESWLETTVNGPGVISFWWKVSSNPGDDFLSFRIGEELKAQIAGEVAWQRRAFVVPAGTVTLRWQYWVGAPAGQNAAWLDQVSLTPGLPPLPALTLQPQSQTARIDDDVLFTVATDSPEPVTYQWWFNGQPLPGATAPRYFRAPASASHQGTYWVVVSNVTGAVSSERATLALEQPAAGWEWAVQPEYGRSLSVFDAATDGPGNAYLIGAFEDYVGFGPRDLHANSTGSVGYLVKYSSAGQPLWATMAGNGLSSAWFDQVAITPAGQVVVLGDFVGEVSFAFPGPETNLTLRADHGWFLAQFASDGALLMARSLEGLASGSVQRMRSDGAGHLYLLGSMDGQVTFGSTTLTTAGSRDLFLAKLLPTGQALWAVRLGGTNYDAGADLAVDSAGQAYVSGWSEGPLTLGTNRLAHGQWIAKFGPDGFGQWLVEPITTPFGGYDQGYALAVDAAGNLYASGSFSGTTWLGTNVLSTPWGLATFLAKYDPAGQVLWARQSGGDGTAWGRNLLATDSAGNVALSGWFSGVMTFGRHAAVGDWTGNFFVARYDSTGTAQWVRTAHAEDFPLGRSLAGDGAGNLFAAGYYSRSAEFGTNQLQAGTEIYLARLAAREVPPVIVAQPVSQTRFVGHSATFSVMAEGTLPLSYQWFLNGHPIPGATNATLTLAHVQPDQAGHYGVSVHNLAGTVLSSNALLTVLSGPTLPGSLDLTFDPTAGGTLEGVAGEYPGVTAVAVQPDGKLLIGGNFTRVNGQLRRGLARLQPDGTLDASFDAALGNYANVLSLAVQPDGRIVIAGSFFLPGHSACSMFARLNPDGSLDPTFALLSNITYGPTDLLRQPDGRILLAGEFTILNPTDSRPLHYQLARFHADGRVETNFAPGILVQGGEPAVYALALQPDGKILIGGDFRRFAGVERMSLARLNADGTLDATFVPPTNEVWFISSLVVQPDGKVLAGGNGGANGATGPEVVRLNPDGSRDLSWQWERPPGADWIQITTMVRQPDGRLLIGGSHHPDGVCFLLRLQPDGSLDPSFGTGPALDGLVNTILLQTDGSILIGGGFTTVAGLPRRAIARLNNDLLTPFLDRSLPGAYLPGASFTVQLSAQPTALTSVYAVEDQLPAGWTAVNVSDGGEFDPATGKVKFGPFYDAVARQLSYSVLVPAGATGAQCFQGLASADGLDTPVGGASCLSPLTEHPADITPPLLSLAIGEVTAYGAAWRRGQTWALPPNPIPIDYLTRAAFLWRKGECYTLATNALPAPLWWVPCAAPAAKSLDAPLPPGTASSQQPAAFVPGESLPVTIRVAPAGSAMAYAVQDTFPAGWSVSQISHDGIFDPVNHQVKWGPFFDANPRELTYQATPPPTASGLTAFAGTASFDGTSAAITGTRQLQSSARLRVACGSQPGQLIVSLLGESEGRYLLETSTDLITWEPLTTATASAGRLEIPLPTPSTHPALFFRARRAD